MKNFPYTRIIVVGTTSSGKSTLAETLSNILNLDFVELDALYWHPNWVGTPDDEFISKVDDATSGERWVVAGTYSRTVPTTWRRAEVIIWLDYSLPLIFWQLIKRTFRRNITREVMWGTNTDRFWIHFKFWSDESLVRWLFETYKRRKWQYPYFLDLPEHEHLKLLHFERPKETREWVEGLKSKK
ncbi:MAG: adenylate kinase [Anaerolineae bacterium]|jgi:adenylate kinase family enzyme|nr:adenylate kinase [Anaerolineae bacterium]MBT4308928.1 adenylate kinase [Anaerolineae bacterium]MBT4456764.1 adenylate kinase [Anaerolineae bacterium]MBT4842940.1 adenylate kinase [Anaerolineae bacterium]MBT6061294.1 adenylate kinase [Anaerolineae bacterium]